VGCTCSAIIPHLICLESGLTQDSPAPTSCRPDSKTFTSYLPDLGTMLMHVHYCTILYLAVRGCQFYQEFITNIEYADHTLRSQYRLLKSPDYFITMARPKTEMKAFSEPFSTEHRLRNPFVRRCQFCET
jgi:hypothetical protein